MKVCIRARLPCGCTLNGIRAPENARRVLISNISEQAYIVLRRLTRRGHAVSVDLGFCCERPRCFLQTLIAFRLSGVMFYILVPPCPGTDADGSSVLVVWRFDGGRRQEKHADTRTCIGRSKGKLSTATFERWTGAFLRFLCFQVARGRQLHV